MRIFHTYIHRRKSDGSVFYVGKGTGRRPHSKSGRNNYWKRTVARHGWTSDIVATWATNEEALAHEVFLIECFRSMGHSLCNLTNGGEGGYGWIRSESAKEATAKHKRKRVVCIDTGEVFDSINDAAISANISRATMGTAVSGKWHSAGGKRWALIPLGLQGQLLTEWILDIQAKPSKLISHKASSIGRSKRVLCIDTGAVYGSVTAAANSTSTSMSNMVVHLGGASASCDGLRFCFVPKNLEGQDLGEWINKQMNAPIPLIGLALQTSTRRKKVLCVDTGVIYSSAGDVVRDYPKIKRQLINCAASGYQLSAGDLRWRYVPKDLHGIDLDKWVLQQAQCLDEPIGRKCLTGTLNHAARAVVCIEEGKVFPMIKDATEWVRLTTRPTAVQSNISSACNKLGRAYGYTWRYHNT